MSLVEVLRRQRATDASLKAPNAQAAAPIIHGGGFPNFVAHPVDFAVLVDFVLNAALSVRTQHRAVKGKLKLTSCMTAGEGVDTAVNAVPAFR